MDVAERVIEEARLLEEWARGPLSDAVLRARGLSLAATSPVDVRITVSRRVGRRHDRVIHDEVTSTGVHVWLLDDNTAVALARGGVLLRGAGGVFAPAGVQEVAEHRSKDQLHAYLAAAEALLVAVNKGVQRE